MKINVLKWIYIKRNIGKINTIPNKSYISYDIMYNADTSTQQKVMILK